MIVDTLENWSLYFSGDDWKTVADFLALDENSEDGEYSVKGDEIFARVMSYQTRRCEEAVLEAHREYIDIQMVLAGAEGIAWHPVENLAVRDSYDAAKDVEFYLTPETFPLRVDLTRGKFVVFFPDDAHMAQLQVDGMPDRLKKVVVKVRTSLYRGLGTRC